MDQLRQQQQQQVRQQRQQRTMNPSFQPAKETAKQIGAIGLSINNLTNALIEVDPEQWALNAQSLNHRLQDVSNMFQRQLETYVRETAQQESGAYAETATGSNR